MEAFETIALVAYFTCLFGLSCYGLHRYLMVGLYFRHKRHQPQPAGRFQELPRVTVQLPIYNEQYVVERLVEAVAGFDYPRDRLQIQVLDDSTDETQGLAREKCGELARRGFDIHYLHRDNRAGFKAGALQHGLQTATGELIAIFDADFLPQPDMLQQTVHYFTDPAVGLVQTRWGHLNAGYSLLTRVQAVLVDAHLLIEQTARNRSGRFFNFNGTAGVWRKSCIEDVGGWTADTLAEDTDLSYRAQMKGWRFVFLPDVITPAELPVDINAFKTQQHRWAKGLIQTCRKVLPAILRSSLPLRVKVEAFVHLTANFGYVLMLGLCLLLGMIIHMQMDPRWAFVRLLLLDGPVFIAAGLSVMVFYFCAQMELKRGFWRSVYMVPLLMAVGIGLTLNNARAVLEAMAGHRSDFARTPKYGIRQAGERWQDKKYATFRGLLPCLELAFGVYFSALVVSAAARANWLSVPFLMLFQLGFLWIGWLSFAQARRPARSACAVRPAHLDTREAL
jgi:cellulose synthase/poly-beta-1,6-N-acetylglucosamine synthase-like glycosyltransferase